MGTQKFRTVVDIEVGMNGTISLSNQLAEKLSNVAAKINKDHVLHSETFDLWILHSYTVVYMHYA
jgi:hypothetical protein